MRLGDAHLLRELSQWGLAALLRDAFDDARAALGLIVADATTAMALELIQIRHGERCCAKWQNTYRSGSLICADESIVSWIGQNMPDCDVPTQERPRGGAERARTDWLQSQADIKMFLADVINQEEVRRGLVRTDARSGPHQSPRGAFRSARRSRPGSQCVLICFLFPHHITHHFTHHNDPRAQNSTFHTRVPQRRQRAASERAVRARVTSGAPWPRARHQRSPLASRASPARPLGLVRVTSAAPWPRARRGARARRPRRAARRARRAGRPS